MESSFFVSLRIDDKIIPIYIIIYDKPTLADRLNVTLQMNYTRLMWGGDQDLNCTQHDRDDMPVLLTSFIILTAPLLFYGASCICGERRKLKLLTRELLNMTFY